MFDVSYSSTLMFRDLRTFHLEIPMTLQTMYNVCITKSAEGAGFTGEK